MGEDFKVDPSSVIDRLDRDLRKGRIVMLVVGGFLGLVVVMGFWLGLAMLKFQHLPSSFRAVPYIMMGAPIMMMLLILWGFFGNRRKYWKLRSVLSTASSADFRRICPWCSGTAFEEAPCCRRFARSWEPGDLNRAWQDYVVSGMTAFVIIKRGSEDSTADTSMFDWILKSRLGANTQQRRIAPTPHAAPVISEKIRPVIASPRGGFDIPTMETRKPINESTPQPNGEMRAMMNPASPAEFVDLSVSTGGGFEFIMESHSESPRSLHANLLQRVFSACDRRFQQTPNPRATED